MSVIRKFATKVATTPERMPPSDGLVCASRSIGCHAYRSIDIKVTVRLSFRVSSIDISVVGTSAMLLEPVRLQKQAAMSRLASDRAVTHTHTHTHTSLARLELRAFAWHISFNEGAKVR